MEKPRPSSVGCGLWAVGCGQGTSGKTGEGQIHGVYYARLKSSGLIPKLQESSEDLKHEGHVVPIEFQITMAFRS